MGREIRFVGPKWEDHEEPLRDGRKFERDLKEFAEFPDWYNGEPDPKDYTADREKDPVIGMVMYENTSEGTPISPVFDVDDKEGMAEWLEDSGASMFGSIPTSKSEWLAIIEQGWSVGVIVSVTDGSESSV